MTNLEVDSPGLGCADIPNAAKITRRQHALVLVFHPLFIPVPREFPNMIFEYLRNRNALKRRPYRMLVSMFC